MWNGSIPVKESGKEKKIQVPDDPANRNLTGWNNILPALP